MTSNVSITVPVPQTLSSNAVAAQPSYQSPWSCQPGTVTAVATGQGDILGLDTGARVLDCMLVTVTAARLVYHRE